MKKYKSVAVLGTQWGDEGKGKITNLLALEADYVVRYQGGNNAGHSISINGKRFALHLLPSGVLNEGVKNVIANGVVVDLEGLLKEINYVKEAINVDRVNLLISDRAHIVLPYHKIIDALQEDNKGVRKIGTTKKGIGPAYADKVSREGIRIADLYDETLFKSLLKENVKSKNELIKLYGGSERVSFTKLYNQLMEYREEIRDYVVDTSKLIFDELNSGKKVLFEGAQGVLLDIEHGTYPFVTSSSPSSSSIPVNVGIPTYMISNSIGIVKAYSTRVGTGGFPTEIDDDISKYIREKGNEFGTTTGRPRRVGWFDSVLVRHAARVSGLTHISLTLLDVLSGLDKVKIATHYELDGKKVDTILAGETDFNNSKPVYVEIDGWKEDITNVKSYKQLPKNAKEYIKLIEKYTGVKVYQFSVGPNRDQTVTLGKKIF